MAAGPHSAAPRIRRRRISTASAMMSPDQLHHRGDKRVWLFLRQIVAGTRDHPMRNAVREFSRARLAVGRGNDAIARAIESNRRYRNYRQRREPSLDVGIL